MVPAKSADPADPPHRTVGRRIARVSFALVGLALLAGAGWTARTQQLVTVPTSSMQPVIVAGDRLLVDTRDRSADVGDVIVVDAPQWLGTGGTTLVVKRVVATAGQRVVCCDDDFRVTVDGVAVAGGTGAPQVMAGDGTRHAGDVPFDVLVPPGRVFLMGDNRPASEDSRAHLDVEGGTLPVAAVVGHPAFRLWPATSFGPLNTGTSPAAPSDVQRDASPAAS